MYEFMYEYFASIIGAASDTDISVPKFIREENTAALMRKR